MHHSEGNKGKGVENEMPSQLLPIYHSLTHYLSLTLFTSMGCTFETALFHHIMTDPILLCSEYSINLLAFLNYEKSIFLNHCK